MSLISWARNLPADAAATIVLRVSALEPAYIGVGKLLWKLPLARTLYRRSTDTLTRRLRAEGRQFRPIRVGPRTLWLDVTDFTAKGLYFLSIPYEPATIQWMLDHLTDGDIVLDVGANHGYHTVVAASVVGETGHVHAFEPNPNVLEQLRDHIRVNDFERRVTVHETALSDADSDGVDFFISTRAFNSGVSSLDPSWDDEATPGDSRRQVRVRMRRVDDWRAALGIDRIDLVKIDVEGAEDRVIRGMARTLEAAPPAHIICETTEASETHRVLTARGYHSAVLERVGELANILYTHRARAARAIESSTSVPRN